ncbi:MAG: hypothetical protein ACRDJ4_13910 [Actinomycetota bacterium]
MAATAEATAPGSDRKAKGVSKAATAGSSPARDRLRSIALSLTLLAVVGAVIVPTVVVKDEARMFLVKMAAFVLLSFLPGWLYLQFVRHRAPSLYDEYVLNLFRLHIDEFRNLPMPPKHTTYFPQWQGDHEDLKRETGSSTKDNLYRKKFEIVFGRAAVSTYSVIHEEEGRERPSFWERTDAFSPVLLATVVLALGWALILQPELVAAVNLFPGLQLSGRPRIPNEILIFGFLGAYSFILQDLIRRYFRADLKAGAYVSAAVRIVVVALLVFALHQVWASETGSSQEAAFAFLVGFFPLSGLQALRELVARPLGRVIPSFRVKHPLHELEGLNIWYEARLSEEGIEDMQNLVSANLVDLLLSTRVPVTRMTDWIDQACLRLHLPRPSKKAGAKSALAQLKQMGIRTATELERAYKRLRDDESFVSQLARAVGLEGPQAGRAAATGLIEAFKGETNLFHVREFRGHEWLYRDAKRGEVHRVHSIGHRPGHDEVSPASGDAANGLASITSSASASTSTAIPSSPPHADPPVALS